MTCRPSSCSRTMRFCSRSSDGCGMWFQSFQKSWTVLKFATFRVASEYWLALASLACMICSQIVHVNRSGSGFFTCSSISGVVSSALSPLKDLLSKKDLFSLDLSLPEIALDLTGLAGIIVAIYGVSYAYYLQQKMEAADAKAAKKAAADKKKAAAAKKAEAEAKKAAAAAAKEADEST